MTRARAAWLLLGMFLLGAACGAAGFGAYLAYRYHHGGFQSEQLDRLVTNRLARRLRLDATQKEILRQVVARTHARMQEARESLRPRFKEILDQGHEELVPVLRPDQVEELNRIRAEMEARHSLGGPPP